MTDLTTEFLRNGPVQLVEVLHPGPPGINAYALAPLIDGGAAATVYGNPITDVIDCGGAA
jgi:hypothetical protein